MRDHLKFLPWAPVVFLSAKTGKGLGALFDAVDRVHAARRARVTTGELNRLLARATEANAPKADKGNQPVRILFGSQIGIAPPTFAVSINHPVDLHFSYRRYLENRIREAFGFEGTPDPPQGAAPAPQGPLVSSREHLSFPPLTPFGTFSYTPCAFVV